MLKGLGKAMKMSLWTHEQRERNRKRKKEKKREVRQ